MKINFEKISHELDLECGDRLVLLSYMDDSKLYDDDLIHNNLYRINDDNEIIWKVKYYNPMNNSAFTNLYDSYGVVCAYNFDGIEYVVDSEAGVVTPRILLK